MNHKLLLAIIAFSAIQYSVYLLSMDGEYLQKRQATVSEKSGKVRIEAKLKTHRRVKARAVNQTAEREYCGDIPCDNFVKCLLESEGTPANKRSVALEQWNNYKNISCVKEGPRLGTVEEYCNFLMETAEVQLEFLKAGITTFPAHGFVLSRNITNSSYVGPDTCGSNGVFTSPADEKTNLLVTCLGQAAGIDYVVIDVMSFNESYPEHQEAYRKSDNTSLSFTNWVDEPLSNETGFLCGAIDVVFNETYWINVNCSSPMDIVCTYPIKVSKIVKHLELVVGGAGTNTANLQKIEESTEEASRNPILAGEEILNLNTVQMSVKINKTAENDTYRPPELNMDVAETNIEVNTSGVEEVVTTVVAFTRETNETLQTYTHGNTSSLAVRTLEPPDEVPYVTVSSWDANEFLEPGSSAFGRKKRQAHTVLLNETLNATVRIAFKKVEARKLCHRITLEMLNKSQLRINELARECRFLNPSQLYDTTGCATVTLENDTTLCTCSHTTMFTVLLAVTRVTVPGGVKTLSFVTESISIAFLVATIVIIKRYKSFVKGDGVPNQINLCVALLFLHTLNLLHDVVVLYDGVCVALTIAIHYFFMAAGTWTFVEGIRIFMAALNAAWYSSQNPRKRFRVFMALGWVLPAVFVIIGAGVGISLGVYMEPQPFYARCNKYRKLDNQIQKYGRCWLVPGTGVFYGTLLVPLALMLIMNFGVATLAAVKMLRSKRRQKRNQGHSYKELATAVKNLLFLFLLLGGTWILAFLTGIGNVTSQILFMYANGLVNGSQGIIVFVLYCIKNEAIRGKIFPFKNSRQKHPGVSKAPKTGAGKNRNCYMRDSSSVPTLSTAFSK